MKPYLLSLGAGLLVGIVYHLLDVKSPAPPTIALIGLLGMLIGEQIIPVAKRIVTGQPVLAYVKSDCAPSILGPQAAPKTAAREEKA
jgi:XapX domain-containing protein